MKLTPEQLAALVSAIDSLEQDAKFSADNGEPDAAADIYEQVDILRRMMDDAKVMATP